MQLATAAIAAKAGAEGSGGTDVSKPQVQTGQPRQKLTLPVVQDSTPTKGTNFDYNSFLQAMQNYKG